MTTLCSVYIVDARPTAAGDDDEVGELTIDDGRIFCTRRRRRSRRSSMRTLHIRVWTCMPIDEQSRMQCRRPRTYVRAARPWASTRSCTVDDEHHQHTIQFSEGRRGRNRVLRLRLASSSKLYQTHPKLLTNLRAILHATRWRAT